MSMRTRSAVLVHQQPRHAARGIAAALHLAAIGVEDAHGGIGAVAGAFDHDDLIAADAEPPVGDGARGRGVQRKPLFARVEHDEIVAQPVHFQERGHGRAYIGASPLVGGHGLD